MRVRKRQNEGKKREKQNYSCRAKMEKKCCTTKG
jgi:hypothetical protein